NLLLLIGYLAFCSFVFSIHGFYRSRRSLQWHERVARIFVALFIAAGALAGLREPFEFSFATDGFLLFFWFLGCLSLILVHETSHVLQYIARLHGRQYRNVVIIGEGQRALNLAAHIEQQPTLGYRLLRIISTKENEV
ncbi:MAG TPA: hypothetical protein VFM05_14470, partial [Candidatus Saccharimonadales bacterium]|nr:hypothetical protein [Candidatus Saccharimonadales bacterium]